MAKERSGYTFKDENGHWFARLTFTDQSGKRRNIKRRGSNRTEAKEILRRLIRELDDHGEKAIETERMTFKDLAEFYMERYAVPPQYHESRKVSGLRSYKTVREQIGVLKEYFGNQRLRSITHSDIEKFKTTRLATPTYRGSKRSLARVHRELATLRRVLNIAQREGWLIRNPFNIGDNLISAADEHKRERIITREEEDRLLAACNEPRADHLRPIIICALDTGMRKGEILSLRWRNIDFGERIITIEALNTKTLRQRQAAMTARLERELWRLFQAATSKDDLVFGIKDNVKRSFTRARKISGLSDVRFHDLRHTAATRLVEQHLPLSEVGRVLGHTQPVTTYRYVNANIETARRAAMALDDFHEETAKRAAMALDDFHPESEETMVAENDLTN